MVPKRGQPPKGENKRKNLSVHLSPTEREKVEEARTIESPDTRIGAYVRGVIVEHAEKVIRKK